LNSERDYSTAEVKIMELELIKTFIEYHIDMSRRVWDSIQQITEEQFLADDAYSRGSIRNLMVHLASTDLPALKIYPILVF
jgi:uncharacterized damage-inducible protein DinB